MIGQNPNQNWDHSQHLVPGTASAGQELALYDPYLNQYTPETEFQLRDCWKIILKYKWTILAILSAVLITTAVATMLERPVYRATTLIQLKPETSGILRFKTIDAAAADAKTYRNTQANIIRSRNVAEAVVARLNLEKNPEIAGAQARRGLISGVEQISGVIEKTNPENDQDKIKEQRLRERITTGRVISSLGVAVVPASDLFRVSFDSFDPSLAARVVNTVVEEFIRLSAEQKFNSTAGAKAFLDKEIKRLQGKLESSERDLTQFARQFKVIDVEETNNIIVGSLSELSSELASLEGERISAEAIYLQSLEENFDPLSSETVVNDDTVKALATEYNSLQAKYFKLSRVFTDAYPEVAALKSQIAQVKSALEKEAKRAARYLKDKYEQLVNKEKLLRKAVDKKREELLDLKDRSVQYHILKREWETNKELYAGILERVKEVGVAAGLKLNNISVVDKALAPASSYKPNFTYNMTLALIFGLAAALGTALILSLLDNTIRSTEEMEKKFRLASFGLVPKHVDHKKNKSTTDKENDKIEFAALSDSSIGEAFRSIRTSLMFASPTNPKIFQITSATSGEGKTTCTTNLGIVLAQNGARVLLIDGDLRKSRMHKIFRVPSSPGLSEALVGENNQVIHGTNITGLSLMAAGTIPPNPAELLHSAAMGKLLENLSEVYDYILMDSPPVLGLADSLIISNKVEGTLLVASSGKVTKEALRESVKRLRGVRARLFGAVLNMADMHSKEYGYHAKYYYNNDYKYEWKEKRKIA